jgi:hypothetical protein
MITSTHRTIEIRDSRVSTAASINGGNIKLTAPLRVEIVRSELTGQAGNDGAQIEIDPRWVILQQSVIDGRAGGAPVEVIVDPHAVLIQDSETRILTPAVSLPPELDLAGGLVSLPAGLSWGRATLPPQCATQFIDSASSFTVFPSGADPVEPGGWLPSFTRSGSGTDMTTSTSSATPAIATDDTVQPSAEPSEEIQYPVEKMDE